MDSDNYNRTYDDACNGAGRQAAAAAAAGAWRDAYLLARLDCEEQSQGESQR